jgi:hypothetical protein
MADSLQHCLVRFQAHKDVRLFLVEVSSIPDVTAAIPDELATAYEKGDLLRVELLVLAGQQHPSSTLVPIACRILTDRNESLNNEDVIELLEVLRSEDSVRCLAETLDWHPDWDEYGNLGVKCVWALKAIGTEEARLVIRSQLGSEFSKINEAASKALEEDNAASASPDTTTEVVR